MGRLWSTICTAMYLQRKYTHFWRCQSYPLKKWKLAKLWHFTLEGEAWKWHLFLSTAVPFSETIVIFNSMDGKNVIQKPNFSLGPFFLFKNAFLFRFKIYGWVFSSKLCFFQKRMNQGPFDIGNICIYLKDSKISTSKFYSI